MILIYSPEENARVTWTFNLIFKQLLGLDYQITTFPDELMHAAEPRLNYSFKPVADIPFIEASGLLFEYDIHDQSPRLIPGEKWAGLPVIFSSENNRSVIPFDIFSAIFYFVSRYEEYLPFEPDEHHRFRSTESLAFHLDLIETPIINLWVKAFRKVLEATFGQAIACREPEYDFTPTIDIDNAWAYAHKGWKRTLGGLWKDRRNMEARNFRFQVLRDNQPDPFNTYALLHHFHAEAGIHPIWFFLIAGYGQYDKNVSPDNPHLIRLIKSIAASDTVGIHPSFASNSTPELVRSEINQLAEILDRPITLSRQHYLLIRLPDTYRTLLHLGIHDDYSMGFADRPGFRAGIASPFTFFDLEGNLATSLVIHPFMVMDTTLKQYLHLNPDQAIEQISRIVEQVRLVNGTFTSLWHNESLSEWKSWRGWSRVYHELLSIAKK